MRARVIVLAGPSGSGKSRLAERLGLPVLRLDDFYKSAGDPTLPLIADGTTRSGQIDWDHPASWLLEEALAAVTTLCRNGVARVPVYDIARDGRCGDQILDLEDSPLFIAEGIFAPEIVGPCADQGLLAAAYCVTQQPLVTFWRRLTRDLRERRKPPLVLVRRGLALMHGQRGVVARAVAAGCVATTPERAYRAARSLAASASTAEPGGPLGG